MEKHVDIETLYSQIYNKLTKNEKPKPEPEPKMEVKVNKKWLKKVRKDFDKLRHKFSKKK